VQCLLGGLLAVRFEDVVAEDHSPHEAGATSRIDFVLPKERIGMPLRIHPAGRCQRCAAPPRRNGLVFKRARRSDAAHARDARLVPYFGEPLTSRIHGADPIGESLVLSSTQTRAVTPSR
jgi:hypothetical protein